MYPVARTTDPLSRMGPDVRIDLIDFYRGSQPSWVWVWYGKRKLLK